ncbi:MAG: hypothetical protein ABII97_02965 [Patescibacteria group bacterium]
MVVNKKGDKENLQHPTTGTIHAQGTPWRMYGPACGADRFPFYRVKVTLGINDGGMRVQNVPLPEFVETGMDANCKNCLHILRRERYSKKRI